MAKASSYIYKGTLHTMKQLAEAFGVSYARMSFLMKANGMNADKIEAVRGLGKVAKGKKAVAFDCGSGKQLSIREIMEVTGLTYGKVAGRIKKGIRGAELLKDVKAIAADKVLANAAKIAASEEAKEMKRKKREARKAEKKEAREALSASKKDSKPELEKGTGMTPSEFIVALEKERDEYLAEKSSFVASYSDVAELERVLNI